MDAIGFWLATMFVVAVFAAFELAVRLLGDVVGGVRYSVAPGMLNGFRAWAEEPRKRPAGSGGGQPVDGAQPGDGRGDGSPDDDGLVVPVSRVGRDGRSGNAS